MVMFEYKCFISNITFFKIRDLIVIFAKIKQISLTKLNAEVIKKTRKWW